MSKLVIFLLILSFAKFGNCEEDSYRIVGGENADKLKWPFISVLLTGQVYQCGGALIKPNWILTAANCLDENSTDIQLMKKCLGEFGARVGPMDMSNGDIICFKNSTEECEYAFDHRIISYAEVSEVAKIKQFFVHKKYMSTKGSGGLLTAYNIALLQLELPSIEFTPVKMPTKPIYEAKNCMIAGWGWREPTGLGIENGTTNSLQQLSVVRLAQSECIKSIEFLHWSFYTSPEDVKNASKKYTFCVEGSDKKKMAYAGDNGGPLVCDDELQGLMTTVQINQSKPTGEIVGYTGLYTEIICYYNWINKVLELNGETPFKPGKDFTDVCERKVDPDEPGAEPDAESSVKTLHFNQLYLLPIFFVFLSK